MCTPQTIMLLLSFYATAPLLWLFLPGVNSVLCFILFCFIRPTSYIFYTVLYEYICEKEIRIRSVGFRAHKVKLKDEMLRKIVINFKNLQTRPKEKHNRIHIQKISLQGLAFFFLSPTRRDFGPGQSDTFRPKFRVHKRSEFCL